MPESDIKDHAEALSTQMLKPINNGWLCVGRRPCRFDHHDDTESEKDTAIKKKYFSRKADIRIV
jgi:hypothetical protein